MTSMHVNIPNVTPLMTRLKKVVVELVGTGKSHVLFDSYAATEKGLANNLEHSSADDQADSTTFRLAHVTLGMPASDPVFTVSGSVDQYTFYSIATVEYQTAAGGRRVAEVTTVRALPAKRAAAAAVVDVIATNMVSIDAREGAGANTGSTGSTPRSSNSTIIIISVCAVVGAAFVVAGTVFLVKSRLMRSRVTATKSRAFFSNPTKTAPLPTTGLFLGDVQLGGAQRTVASPVHVEEAEPEAVTVTRAAEPSKKRTKVVKKLRATKSSTSKGKAGVEPAGSPFAVAESAPARRVKVSKKMRPVASA